MGRKQTAAVIVLTGLLWLTNYLIMGATAAMVVACFLLSALLVLSIKDWKTYVIPPGINVFIAGLGAVNLILDRERWQIHILGLLCGGVLFLSVYYLTKRKGIGGGDVKLMAAAGLYLGWEQVIVASFFGCLYACVIHLLRMRFGKAGAVLALGPYLAAGIVTALWFGEAIVAWYIQWSV